ncbi:MAG: hypothetical protein IPP32_17880 [Bacteroidetes bacterium]|nr:hypothetical protein [Bacteroidota bacterium]
MIKYLFLLLNVAGLLFFASLFETEPVTVSHNFPESVSTGGEYVIEIKINKNDISGFAEFKQILPDGFGASVIESKKGSFSFTDHEVKIIWMTLPAEKEFVVKYKITVLSSASSEGWVDGTFSFLENNQKSTVNLEKKKIFVNIVRTNLDNPLESAAKKTETINLQTDSSLKLPVMCTRSFSNGTKPKQVLVNIVLKNDSVTGFAKLEELIPLGYIASASELHGAVFSFVDQKVKFLWMSFPFEKEFNVSYFLTATESAEDSAEVNGYLSFTIAEESKKFTLATSQLLFSLMNSAAVSTVSSTEQASEKKDSVLASTSLSSLSTDEANAKSAKEEVQTVTESKQEPNTLAESAKQNEAQTSTSDESTKSASPLGKAAEVTSIPDAQKGISFRVQICATHKPVELSYFKETYKISEEIYAEMHEGWHKFTLNNVNAYKLARDKREELKQNEMIKGPFVTAYNGGARITVQEALMIANQKWVR